MNGNEIRWIVENLFIGNKLTRGQAFLSDGTLVDLTRVEAPIVVLASYGDNITPPQRALNWIPDLYGSVNEIAAQGHVIITRSTRASAISASSCRRRSPTSSTSRSARS